MVTVLVFSAMEFVERAPRKTCAQELGVKVKTPPLAWISGGLLWAPFSLLAWHGQTLSVAIGASLLVALALARIPYLRVRKAIFRHRERYSANGQQITAAQVSRGVLFESVRGIARKAGSATPPIFVLPDASRTWRSAHIAGAVLIPRQLLDSMSRREIDALVARQVCRQSRQYYNPIVWSLLACDVVAVCLMEWLETGSSMRWITALALLAFQFAALRTYVPRALASADRRAIDLTGDPAALLSALAGLARFSNASPLQIPGLPAQPIAPVEDRYPTTGPYVITGLP
jgi:hypothetical protein